MFSRTSQYAVKAAIHLAKNTSKLHKIQAIDLALQIDVPKPFLAKILQNLTSHQLINATKGRNGGFFVTDEQKKNSVYSVIKVAEGKDVLSKCAIGIEKCDLENPCTIHHIVGPSMRELKSRLENTSILQATQDII